MLQRRNVLEYARADGVRKSWLQPVNWAASTLALMFLAMTPVLMCMCGHMGWEVLPVTAGIAFLGCYGWLASWERLPLRVVQIVIAIATLYVFARNVLDVLKFGHNPLW